jgi:class 3 adenylate cyclase/tetratricopeptide (TPR) repeat protein
MQCPRCQHENPPGMKFCGECAASLAATCPSCGAANPPENKFCGQCAAPLRTTPTAKFAAPDSYTPKHLAEKILTSKAALEGERKQVTVLFADLKGSMELLADRDPEEARKLLDPVLELMMEAVHRYEGTVNQVMGDGIMALFGAPLAHEDHAVRACYAALRMQESVAQYAEGIFRSHGVPLQIRVGLNSGEVVVRAIGSDLHMDYTAVGQTTHLAARMEQLADPGTILLAPATLPLVEGYVEVKGRGAVPVKGLAEPLEVSELVGAGSVRSRLQAAASRGLTRFVGRDPEMEQLRLALERAGHGHGQIVAVVGEPGVGKSRLYWEFTHSHRTDGWLVLESRSVSYGRATSYLPVIDLLKGYFQIDTRDDPRRMREKITGKILSLDEGLRPTLPAFLALLDLPVEEPTWRALDPPQRRRRTLDAIKHLLLRESQVQPLAIVFEDLHWIDAETQAFLDSLVESLATARLLLLVNYRPEYQHSWGGKTYYAQLRVDPLPPENAGALLGSLLGGDPALQPLTRLLINRTDGNPFFLEESVRGLVETGTLAGGRGAYRLLKPAETLQIPATAQVILAARIDRLSPEDKRLLQTASIIGKDLPYRLLHAIADPDESTLRAGLARLQGAEFLYEIQLFPEPEYTFKHALTHEVAYKSVLQDRRRTLHARVVGAIEELYADRLVEQIERLAHHALRGEIRERAVPYLRQAGLKAAERSALREARAWFEEALGILRVLPESRPTLEQAFEILIDLRPVLSYLGEILLLLERLREAETLAEKLNDDDRRGRVCAFLTGSYALLGQLDEALESGTRALVSARRLGRLELRILATALLEQVHWLRGEYARAVELAVDNIAALPSNLVPMNSAGAAWLPVFDRFYLATSLAELGRFAEAAEHAAEAIALAEPTNHLFTIALAYGAAAVPHLLKGDWPKAHLLTERGIPALRSGSVALLLLPFVAASALILAQLGEASEAMNRVQEAQQLLEYRRAGGSVGDLGISYEWLGTACLLLGRLDAAQSLAHHALECSPVQFGFAAHVQHLLGDIATHPECFDAATGEAHYRQALALAEPRGMRPLVAHCHLGLGKLYRCTGQREQAREHLTTATTMYREMDMTYWLEQAAGETAALG